MSAPLRTARVRIPLRQRELGGIVGERATGVLVQADRDADVVLAEADGVGGLLNGAGCGGAGVGHVGERDAREPDEPRDRVGVGHLIAAPEAELDVTPVDSSIDEGRLDGLGAHLDGRLLEPAEGVDADTDDGQRGARGCRREDGMYGSSFELV